MLVPLYDILLRITDGTTDSRPPCGPVISQFVEDLGSLSENPIQTLDTGDCSMSLQYRSIDILQKHFPGPCGRSVTQPTSTGSVSNVQTACQDLLRDSVAVALPPRLSS